MNLSKDSLTRRADGVTLMELLVSLIIISVVVYALISYFSSNLTKNVKELKKSELYYVAEQELERIIALDFNSPKLATLGSPNGNIQYKTTEDERFLIKIKVEAIDPISSATPNPYPTSIAEQGTLKKITVSVASTQDPRNPQQVDLVYYKSP